MNMPELECRKCGHVGNDYKVVDALHTACFCGKCDTFIKNLSKEDKYGTKEQQAEIWAKTNGKCCYCSKPLNQFEKRGYTYEHIEARAKGGNHGTENLYPCCQICNSQKGKKSLQEYRQYLSEQNNTPYWVFHFEVISYSSIGDVLKKFF